MPAARTIGVERLRPDDIVAVAQCIAIDADTFPYASCVFGQRDRAVRAWIARTDRGGRVHGFVAGRVRSDVFYVAGLAIDAALRRRGIGRALVAACAQGARAERLNAIALHVAVGNRAAIALYQAEGFAARRLLRGFYPLGALEGEHDAYEMIRALR